MIVDPEASTHLVSRIHKRNRGRGRTRRRVRVGAPDPSLTGNAGMAAISELCDRLDVVATLNRRVGPIKARERGHGAGQLLVGLAAAQLAGQDFLVGLDRHRADAAGQALTPVPGLASTTAAGLARRFDDTQWRAVESGIAEISERMLELLPAPRAAALCSGPVTVDLDTPTWRSTAATRKVSPTTIRVSGPDARTWRSGPKPRPRWPPTWAAGSMTPAPPRLS